MSGTFRRCAISLLLAGVAALSAASQQGSVVVLGEEDFEKVPEAVRGQSLAASGAKRAPSGGGPADVLDFDPKRDAQADIDFAVNTAARQGKRVLLEIGGDWCGFCKILDRFFDANADVTALRQKNFVYVKVNVSEDNQNHQALSEYPPIRSFPHFLVLDGRGKLVRSQRVAHLGTQSGYSPARFREFLTAFGPR